MIEKINTDISPVINQLQEKDQFLTRREAAEYLRRSVPTLERWAQSGKGPAFNMAGGRALYSLLALRRFATGET